MRVGELRLLHRHFDRAADRRQRIIGQADDPVAAMRVAEDENIGLRAMEQPERDPGVGRVEKQALPLDHIRSEEQTSELQSLIRISYAVFCLTQKKHQTMSHNNTQTMV